MRTRAIVWAAAALFTLPVVAHAEGEAVSRMEALEARMMALEDQLAASEATVAAQRQLLSNQAKAGDREGSVDTFLSGLEIGGHVTASYVYNFNNPDFPTGTQPLNQFNQNQNTFALDAVKLEIGKPTDGPGTAGFQFDILYGENNHILCGESRGDLSLNDPDGSQAFSGDEFVSIDNPSDSGVCLQEAYVSYDVRGTEVKFGKFETLLGYEVIDSIYNNHITHGVLFTWAIPLVHTGILASGNLTEEIDWAAGFVNGFNNVLDSGDNKGVLGRLGWSDGTTSMGLNVFGGAEQTRTSLAAASVGYTGVVGNDTNDRWIYDFTMDHSLNDDVTLWLNADYGREQQADIVSGGAATWWGVATGFAWDLSNRTSLAVRGEYFRENGDSRIGTLDPLGNLPASAGNDSRTYTGTVTLGCALTQNLTARLEYRRDWWDVNGSEDSSGFYDSSGFDDTQDLGVFEVSYVFD